MEIRHEIENGIAVVELRGRLDELATAETEQVFLRVVEQGPAGVVLDLCGVEYISSSGLRILLMLSRALARVQAQLKLCGPSPFVAEVFEVSNFSSIFSIYATRQQALDALSAA
jgi:anti-sigma B factor antagonist